MRTLLLASLLLASCATETPTSAVLDNGYAADDGGTNQVVVYRGWWFVTEFLDPVLPGASSGPERSVEGSDFAYVVLAPGWDPSSGAPPSVLLPVRSAGPLASTRGDTLHVLVSPTPFIGDCSSGSPLTQDDADFITHRIFPGDFARYTYDAKTCKLTARP